MDKTTKPDIIIYSKKNPLFFIKISYDGKGRVHTIENPWNVKLPSFIGLHVTLDEIYRLVFLNKDQQFYIDLECSVRTIIYEKTKKLNDLKDIAAQSEVLDLTDDEINILGDRITTLASVLADLNKSLIHSK